MATMYALPTEVGRATYGGAFVGIDTFQVTVFSGLWFGFLGFGVR